MFKLHIFCLVLTVGNYHAFGANILFMHSYASFSHRVSMSPLANALVSRGHNITYIAPMGPAVSNPKIVDIVPEPLKSFVDASINAEFNVEVRVDKQTPNLFQIFDKVSAMACESLLNSAEFQSWMSTSPQIELVIGDLIPDCGVGIAHKLGAKFIWYNTVPFMGKMVEDLKLVDESLTTYCDHTYKPSMTFLERVKNTLVPLAWGYYEYQNIPYLESVLKTGLNITDLPSIYDLLQNVSLVFSTGNYASEQPRSLPPMFVSVPGLHVKEKHDPLPKDLENFISTSDGGESEGFVYISLGTVVIAPHLPKPILEVFMSSIKSFPKIKFLWRWDGEFPTDKPKNLYMAKWFPQQDLLSHPKIRAFVTQSGRPSMQEALWNGVPMISFPILGDQDFNAMRMEDIGAGITLEIGEVTADQLQGSLSRVLNDPSFKRNIKKMSTIFKDLPMKPIDTAVWWTEYVLRHDDLSHLKPLSRNQTWYERRMLDVWLFLFLSCVTAICSFAFLLFLGFKCLNSFIVNRKVKTA